MPQSLSDAVFHIVFSTKDRVPSITEPIEQELYKYTSTICKNLDCPVIKINGVEDHIHILLRLGKCISYSDLISQIKSNSSRWIKTKGKEFKDFSWQGGYGAFVVSRSNVDAAVNYIESQKEHHRVITFKEEFLAMLHRAKISYDERYLWD